MTRDLSEEAICGEKVSALGANRRSFDCAPRDETARGFAQDDIFYFLQIT
jgi:hypothetical protein